tara:strand:+ start:82 stop:426 length:345 start_codon:yes stop_codon:yes gene_type:complete
MKKRIITDPFNLKFEPFDNYGKAIKGMSWHKISYNKETGQGSYILKIDPGAKTIPHEHINYEEFYMLDGDLTDADGKTFKRGNFVTFEPGSSHSSYTEKGCLILVFMRSRNKTI